MNYQSTYLGHRWLLIQFNLCFYSLALFCSRGGVSILGSKLVYYDKEKVCRQLLSPDMHFNAWLKSPEADATFYRAYKRSAVDKTSHTACFLNSKLHLLLRATDIFHSFSFALTLTSGAEMMM